MPRSGLEAETAPIMSSTFVSNTEIADDADIARPNLQPCSLRFLLRKSCWTLEFRNGAWNATFVQDKELFFARGSFWSSVAPLRLPGVEKWLMVLPKSEPI